MEKFIPYAKLSKKKKRELDARRRGVWTISPVTRKPASPKAYNRSKARKWRDDDSLSAPLFFALARRSGEPLPSKPSWRDRYAWAVSGLQTRP